MYHWSQVGLKRITYQRCCLGCITMPVVVDQGSNVLFNLNPVYVLLYLKQWNISTGTPTVVGQAVLVIQDTTF